MNLQQSFQVQDFRYEVRLYHGELSFALLNRPRRVRIPKADDWINFMDDEIYEDVAYQVPVWQVLKHVVGIVQAWLRRYRVRYFTFNAATVRKIQVYERLLQRYLPDDYAYSFDFNAFHVYIVEAS
ncbi:MULTISPECIES: hypothetical protein [Vitreoscilla]|uniref:Uncharacterized protein n=1 Tax=Vitreoscilla stercoraria TaxID=61 RepID=A0ABY4EBM4_VITST|nr:MULTISPECIES: hypothetical protein [Vitreoscilla]AUZ04042.1 hypothetical protein ADP71_02200 [Vitreoscilla sp. C1]UOO93144.1 hypothetical protein LVJ81_03680 [Vitreoscilla stercoraria]